ncbi:MAG: LacI family DNA-binding transcriptional regulator [Actinomycetaceae bacterium]|nr:LacI family DNA-binding transcriptional regulator [Actinomycetaceae bacterium]
MTKNSRATISDVARMAGVSKGTVSRVLKGTYPASQETVDAVHRAVEELGYVASVRARALAVGRADAIAVVLSEPFDYLFEDPTFAAIMKGIFDAMSGTAFVPVVLQMSTAVEQKKALHLISNQAVDGVIHLSPWSDEGLLDALVKHPVPVVLCGQTRNQTHAREFSVVYADDHNGARVAAQHLVDVGVQAPIAILGDSTQPAAIDRLQGYREIFGDRLDDSRIVFGGWSEYDGAIGLNTIMSRGVKFDGVLAGSDRIARGVLGVLRGLHKSVPQDVKIVGFDDHELASAFAPQLTTIAQPMHYQGERAFSLALDMISGTGPTTEVLETELKIRETT